MDKLLLLPPDSDLRFKIATLNLHVRHCEKVFTNRVLCSPEKHKSPLCTTEGRLHCRSVVLQMHWVSIHSNVALQLHALFFSLYFLIYWKKSWLFLNWAVCRHILELPGGKKSNKNVKSSAGGPSLPPPSPSAFIVISQCNQPHDRHTWWASHNHSTLEATKQIYNLFRAHHLSSHHPCVTQGITSLLIVMGAHASSTWHLRFFAGIVIILMTNYKYLPPP